MPHRALRRHDQRALGAHADADEFAGVHCAALVSRTRCSVLHAAAQSRDPGLPKIAGPRLCSAPLREELRAALRPGHGRYLFCAALRSTKVLPPFILWASGASLIWITTASASTPRFFTSACVMSRIMPAFCSSVRPAAMLTVISGILVSSSVFAFVLAGQKHEVFTPSVPASTIFFIKQDVDAR